MPYSLCVSHFRSVDGSQALQLDILRTVVPFHFKDCSSIGFLTDCLYYYLILFNSNLVISGFLLHQTTLVIKQSYEGRSKSFEPDYLPLDFWAKKCYWPYERSLISIL